MVTLASEHNVVLADFHRLKLNHDTPDAQNKPVWEEANLSRMHLNLLAKPAFPPSLFRCSHYHHHYCYY